VLAEERAQVARELGKTAELFGELLSQAKIVLYIEAVDDLAADAVITALTELRKTSRFFPKPAEVRELACGSVDEHAARAWSRFLRALECVGTYSTVTFEDPVIHAVIEAMVGWDEAWRIERLSIQEKGFKRAEFVRLYMSFSRSLPDSAPTVLVGQHEIENRRTSGAWRPGLTHAPAVVAIGAIGEPIAERPALPVAPAAIEQPALPEDTVAELPPFLEAIRRRRALSTDAETTRALPRPCDETEAPAEAVSVS
jgi:hypothetical protein